METEVLNTGRRRKQKGLKEDLGDIRDRLHTSRNLGWKGFMSIISAAGVLGAVAFTRRFRVRTGKTKSKR